MKGAVCSPALPLAQINDDLTCIVFQSFSSHATVQWGPAKEKCVVRELLENRGVSFFDRMPVGRLFCLVVKSSDTGSCLFQDPGPVTRTSSQLNDRSVLSNIQDGLKAGNSP